MHWLDWEQLPTSVRVVWSKIWMALFVPVTLALAVAVKTAFCPAGMNASLAARSSRCTDRTGRSDDTGTLGVTAGAATDSPRVAADAGELGSTVSVHAAGLLRPGLLSLTAHGARPSGVDATPGTALVAPSIELHAAPGPDAGHGCPPAGTLTWVSSAVGAEVHPFDADVVASTPAPQTAFWPIDCRAPATKVEGVVAASATTVSWLAATRNATARCALRRDLKSGTSCRSKRKRPLLESHPQPSGVSNLEEGTGGSAMAPPRSG